ERQAARRLRRLPGGRRKLFDEIDLPSLLQDLLARQRAQARRALEPLVVARELVVVDRRRACGGSGTRDRGRVGLRGWLHQLGIVADLLPLFPAVFLAVHPDRIARAEDERRRRGRFREREADCQSENQTEVLQLRSPETKSGRLSTPAK